MIQDIAENTPLWLEVLADEPGYVVMTTTRGIKDGDGHLPYDSFNVCHYTGDVPGHVADCRRRLAAAVGVETDALLIPRQTHSVNVVTVDELPFASESLEDVDGIVTVLKDVVVGVSTADCVPVILVDSHAGVAAAVHAGWRGALGGVVENAVAEMERHGADKRRMKVYMGPAICVDCFEVGEEVAARFPDECVVRYADGRRPHVDLPAYVCLTLSRVGLATDNIGAFDKGRCTRCHPGRYYSARRLGIGSGRNFTFVKLKAGPGI